MILTPENFLVFCGRIDNVKLGQAAIHCKGASIQSDETFFKDEEENHTDYKRPG